MSNTPRPQAIRAARKEARLTQTEAAEVVSVSLSTWSRWEAGTCPMPTGLYDLFLIVTNQERGQAQAITSGDDIIKTVDALIRDAIALRQRIVRHTAPGTVRLAG